MRCFNQDPVTGVSIAGLRTIRRGDKGQEFVIGGYMIGGKGFDAFIFGYYDESCLRFAAKTRSGFTPSSRAALMKKVTPLVTKECPFVGLPEKRAGRWGQGITAAPSRSRRKVRFCRVDAGRSPAP